jgi:hypothetical protein
LYSPLMGRRPVQLPWETQNLGAPNSGAINEIFGQFRHPMPTNVPYRQFPQPSMYPLAVQSFLARRAAVPQPAPGPKTIYAPQIVRPPKFVHRGYYNG